MSYIRWMGIFSQIVLLGFISIRIQCTDLSNPSQSYISLAPHNNPINTNDPKAFIFFNKVIYYDLLKGFCKFYKISLQHFECPCFCQSLNSSYLPGLTDVTSFSMYATNISLVLSSWSNSVTIGWNTCP